MSEEIVHNNVKVKLYDGKYQKIREKLKEIHNQVKSNKNKIEGINGFENHKKDVAVRLSFIENYIMQTVPVQT